MNVPLSEGSNANSLSKYTTPRITLWCYIGQTPSRIVFKMSRSAQSCSLINEEAGLQGFEGIRLGLRTRSPYLHAHHPSTMMLRSLSSPCPWHSVLPRELLSRHSPSFIRRFTFLQHPHLLLFNSSPTCWWIRHWGDSVLMLCSHKTLSKCQSWWACDVWGGRLSMVCSCEGAIHHRKFLFMGPYLDAPAQGSKEQGEGGWATRWKEHGGATQSTDSYSIVGKGAEIVFVQMHLTSLSSRCWGFKH